MGTGYSFTCSKCKHRFSASWGIGFSFPQVYEDTVKKIKAGAYGNLWQDLVNKEKYVVTDAEKHIYICGKCNAWKSEQCLSLYIPKDPEHLKIKYQLDSVEELNERSYILTAEIRAEYRILKRYIHKCDKCSGVMHRATEEEMNVLTCPKCGGEPEKPGYMGMIMWD